MENRKLKCYVDKMTSIDRSTNKSRYNYSRSLQYCNIFIDTRISDNQIKSYLKMLGVDPGITRL